MSIVHMSRHEEKNASVYLVCEREIPVYLFKFVAERERECVTTWERESHWRMFVSKWVNDSKRVHERIVEFCWKRLTEKKITIWDSLRLVKSVLRKLKQYRQSKGYLKVCVKCSVTRCFYYLYDFAICNKEILPSGITYFHCLIKIVPN